MNPPELQQVSPPLATMLGFYGRSPSAQTPEPPITPKLIKSTLYALVAGPGQAVLLDRNLGGALHVMKLFERAPGTRTKTGSYSMRVDVQRTLKHRATPPPLTAGSPAEPVVQPPPIPSPP